MDYLRWFWRTKNFFTVSKRRSLVYTSKSKLLVLSVIIWALFLTFLSFWLFVQALHTSNFWLVSGFVTTIVVAPYVLAIGMVIPLWLGEKLVQKPKERLLVAEAVKKLADHEGVRVAVAGSFGKTSFKEMLATILSESKVVASTPGNMNTLLGTSIFVQQLSGKEEIIIFELGESHVGDVAELSTIVRPDIGIITGINEAHLTTFGSLDRTIATVFELKAFVKKQSLYKNGESDLVMTKVKADDPLVYSSEGVNGWEVTDIQIGIEGTSFVAMKRNKTVWAKSRLLGRHQIGPLVACIDIAEKLGLSVGQISEGITNTKPFEHRMQPRRIAGAWVIDDTYNGNVQGVEVGL
ncbi:MAG: Mur ligase family protein, partial [Microcoleus sp.]